MKWKNLKYAILRNSFIALLFKMASETGSTENITFHLSRKYLNIQHKLCSQAVPMDMGAMGLHLAVIRQLLKSIT